MATPNGVAGALATRQEGAVAPGESLRKLAERTDVRKRFEDMLGKKAAGFISSMMTLANQKKELAACDPRTIIASAAIAASLDLPINANLGFAHIVPYKGMAQFQMGWKGFVQLAQRSGLYKTMNVAEVYEGEIIKHNRITGEMEIDEARRANEKVVGYVAYIRLLNGFEKYLYMTVEQVTRHGQRYSKAFKFGPWQENFDAMAKKTVLKLLLSKYAPLSVEMQAAVVKDQGVPTDISGEEVSYPDNGGVFDAETIPPQGEAPKDQAPATPEAQEPGDAQEPVDPPKAPSNGNGKGSKGR